MSEPSLFSKAVSAKRFAPYLESTGSVALAEKRYLWNVTLCEALYPAFHCCEVLLRNSVHRTLSTHLQSSDWAFDRRHLLKRESDTIDAVISSLKTRNRELTCDNLISELTFGFWSSMFSGPYEERIWRIKGLLRRTFPAAPRAELRVSQIHSRLNHLREFRNRVFHHEPIWHRGDLLLVHAELHKFGSWISTEAASAFLSIDRFRTVFADGPELPV